MKWENDRFSYEKALLFDAIMRCIKYIQHKDLNRITDKELSDFVDKFFEKYVTSKGNQDEMGK